MSEENLVEQLNILFGDKIGGVVGGVALSLVVAGAITYYIMYSTKHTPIKTSINMENQSIEVEPGVRISGYLTKDSELMKYLFEDSQTLYECFQRGIRVSENGNCLGSRTGPNKSYEWISYPQVYEKAVNFGSGLIKLGLKPGSFIGIYSANRIEWTLAEQACNTFSMVTVPLYDTLGVESCQYIINQIGTSVVVCDKPEKAQILLKQAAKIPSLKYIILFDKITETITQTAKTCNIQLLHFSDVEESGKTNPVSPVLPKPEDLATICYTSGTTGDPKGVMLTHSNLVSNISAIAATLDKAYILTKDDVHLSYLPLAHMFERGMQLLLFMHGAKIGFFQGDIKLLTDDMQTLRPTLFPTVPRLLNRMYQRVITGVRGSKIKSTLLDWGMKAKLKEIKRGIIRRDSIWDKLIFNKIQTLLGGRIKILISGSAPLSEPVLNFTRCAFGCLVLEGYGQTEATAGIVFNIPGESIPGHCGPPLVCNYVKLIDVPEMDYFADQGTGEILAKGPNVFKGYYKNPEKTEEALDKDGWLHTGDIGTWLPNGTLKIVDRKKNIFKLSQGEYIAAEKIENIYQRSSFVAQVFIEGDSLKHFLMAVAVLDEEYILKWAKNNNQPTSLKELSQSQEVKDIVLKDLLKCGKDAQLKGFEQIKDVYLHPELFSIENGLLTPTFKNKRPALRKNFKGEIDALYQKHQD
ncbi:long-chain-fatty-acid--CoA ligase 1 [Patella vulgata]|uniref:long-chain-fatty-acid--CoA ligase 1 n=1 Tax=Patella vulgata TaxID=6465 RepID=UPI0021803CB3|nr:long-chain-fatty-acid--CoA ligase 1 [Patella vulgata]